MEQPSSEEENHSDEPSETVTVPLENPASAEEQPVAPPEKRVSAEEQSVPPPENLAPAEERLVPPPENPPPTETPVPTISVEQNGGTQEKELSPNHRRGTTIDFHDLLSINTKSEKMHRSQSVSVMRRSLDGLSEEREITQFPNGSDEMPVRLRVRVNGGHERQVVSRGFVETQTRLESVKSVVSKFGGSVDYRFQRSKASHKTQNQLENVARMAMLEVDNVRREVAQYKMKSETVEVSTAELLKELENNKRRMNGLKAKLDKAETEESKLKEELNRAKRYLEIAEIFAREGGKSEQLDKVKTQQEAAVSELNSVKEEIKSLKEECETLAKEKENLVVKAEEAVLASKNAEKMVEEFTDELANVRKLLEIATVAKQETEERKVGASLAKDEECLMWNKEIKEADEELLQLGMQIASAKELEGKLDVATGLLEKLNAELEVYMKKLNPEKDRVYNEEEEKKQEMLDSKKKELEEVKAQIERVQEEVDVFRVEVSSIKTELEKEKIELADLKQREELALVEIPSIETKIEKTKEQIDGCIEKEKEAKRKIDELPSLIEEATLEAKKSKSIAQDAEDELNKVKTEAEPVLVSFKTIQMKINATMKEIEASKMSENIALGAIKALEESEMDTSSEKVTISFEEYFGLRKQGHEAAERAQERVDAVAAQIETAKESATNSYAILYEVYNELDEKKKMLHETKQKGTRAAQGKTDAEQELKHLKAKYEEQHNSIELANDEVAKPEDEITKPADEVVKPVDEVIKPMDEADIEVIKPDMETNGDTGADEDNKAEVKIDEAINGEPTIGEPNIAGIARSNSEDSLDRSNGCCLSGRSSRSDGEMIAFQSPDDGPVVIAGKQKKKRNFFRTFWEKRKAQSVAT